VPQPSVSDGHVDVLLTNFSVAYSQAATNFIAGQVFGTIPVQHASDLYLKYPKGAFFRDDVTARPYGGESNVIGFELDKDTYYCEEQALSTFLDDRERANATPPYDPERGKTMLLTQQHLIHRDADWSRSFFKTGVWGTDMTGVTASPSASQFLQFDDPSSTPIELIDQQKEIIAEATGVMPNKLVLGAKAYRVLKNHPSILDRIKYTQRAQVTEELLAAVFEVERVLVPRAIRNTAKEGQTDQMAFIHDKKAMLLTYDNPFPAMEQVTAGAIFSWTGLLGDAAYNAGVWRGRDERKHSDWFEVRMAYSQKVIASDCAVFFATAVA
jgi:hypothetical protein